MNQNSSDVHWWFGLCPKAPVFRASQIGIVNLPEPSFEGSPDGGAGGSKTIRRGIWAALSGTKTLIHNRQLLWFTFLAGLVLAGNAIGQAALRNIRWIMQPDIIVSYGLDFLLGFATLFCQLIILLYHFHLLGSSKQLIVQAIQRFSRFCNGFLLVL